MVYGGEKMNLIEKLLERTFVLFVDRMAPIFLGFLFCLGIYCFNAGGDIPDYKPSLEVIENTQAQLKTLSETIWQQCNEDINCYNQKMERRLGFDYDVVFGNIKINLIKGYIKDAGYYNGLLVGVFIGFTMLSILLIFKNTTSLLSNTMRNANIGFNQTIKMAQQETTRIAKLLYDSNSELEKFKNIIAKKNLVLDDKTEEIHNDILEKLYTIQTKIQTMQSDIDNQHTQAFENAVSRSKDNIIRSNKEITQETENAINQLQTMLKEIRESMDVYIAIAQKKKANEEKRKYHGKVKEQQLKEQTKQELIKEGRRIRDERE